MNNNERKEGFKMVSSKFMGERQTKEKKGFRLNRNRVSEVMGFLCGRWVYEF